MIKYLGRPSLRSNFHISFQRFTNARVDATLAVIFLVAFQIVCLCSLILTSIHCVSQSYHFSSDGKKLHRIPPHPGGNREIPKAWSIAGGPVGAPTGPLHAL